MATKSLTPYLSLATFESLHEVAEGSKKKVSINRQDLLNLLMDHARFAAALARLGIDIEGNYPTSKVVYQAGQED